MLQNIASIMLMVALLTAIAAPALAQDEVPEQAELPLVLVVWDRSTSMGRNAGDPSGWAISKAMVEELFFGGEDEKLSTQLAIRVVPLPAYPSGPNKSSDTASFQNLSRFTKARDIEALRPPERRQYSPIIESVEGAVKWMNKSMSDSGKTAVLFITDGDVCSRADYFNVLRHGNGFDDLCSRFTSDRSESPEDEATRRFTELARENRDIDNTRVFVAGLHGSTSNRKVLDAMAMIKPNLCANGNEKPRWYVIGRDNAALKSDIWAFLDGSCVDPDPEPCSKVCAPRPVTSHEPCICETPPIELMLPVTPQAADTFEDAVAVGDRHRWKCSGVLVAERVVLTARHCLPATRIALGPNVKTPFEVVAVIDHSPHPDRRVDAVLLQLDEDVRVRLHTRRSAGDNRAPMGGVLHVGFGAIDPTGRHGFGQKHFVTMQASGWGCDRTSQHRTGCNPLFEMALASSGGRDTCNGDSGGPLYESAGYRTKSGVRQKHWRVLAITSRPIRRARVTCGDGGIYIRIDRIADWLEPEINRLNQKK